MFNISTSSYAHAPILCASTDYWRGVQFTFSNEVEGQNARSSKVITTERPVFFSDDYEIESGQGNDTVSVQCGSRQNTRPSKLAETLYLYRYVALTFGAHAQRELL